MRFLTVFAAWTLGCRSAAAARTDRLARHLDQDDLQDQQNVTNNVVPLTPRRTIETIDSSLVEETVDSGPPQCYSSKWELSTRLGAGNNAEVYEVIHKSTGQVGALKMAFENSQGEIISERSIMEKMNCPGVLGLLDGTPCDFNPYAYVMPILAGGGLDTWSVWQAQNRWRCAQRVTRDLLAGLTCIHDAGFLHNDFKSDNVFYGGTDVNGCPIDLKIGDFGLTTRLGIKEPKFASEYYIGSNHLVADMFETDAHGNSKYTPSRWMDLCSLKDLIWALFNLDVPVAYDSLKSCGLMSHGRSKTFVIGDA